MTDEAPPGWYLDPVEEAGERWWNGIEWTEQLRPVLSAGLTPTGPPIMADDSHVFPPESLVWIPSLQSAGRVTGIDHGGSDRRLVKVNGSIVRFETAQLMPFDVDEPDASQPSDVHAQTMLPRIVDLERQIDQISRSLKLVVIAAWIIVAQFAFAVILALIARGRI